MLKGIDPLLGDKIFEEHFQIGNLSRDRTKGLGLGLSIARRMARLLNGEVDYRSCSGRGTVFEIVLPQLALYEAGKESESQRDTRKTVLSAEKADYSRFSGWRVIVVEDDLMVAKSIELSLKTLDIRVDVFHSAELAMASPEIMDADFYISDFSLPGLNGIQLLDTLRQRSSQVINAVLVTGETSPERIEMASSTHWKVLFKPVELSSLLAVMEAVQASK